MSSFLPEHYSPSSAIRNNYRASVAVPTWNSPHSANEYSTGASYRASIADPTWASHLNSDPAGVSSGSGPGGLGPGSSLHHHMRPHDQHRYSAQPAMHHAEIPPRRPQGFRRLRDMSELKPNLDIAPTGKGRRADPAGGYVSPLKALTSYLHHTYHLVNPAFLYELSFNPRRVLTKPDKPMYNDGHDNEESDYILYVNDYLGSEGGSRYVILDILGQGTFGQVVKCQNMRTREICAVKVIKNKPAYFNQSMMEVTILEMLNKNWDPNDEHHILRLRDTFIHAKHLCLVFELLSSNLYELIKQNSFRGLSTSLVRVFTAQLLDALTVLNEARLIHCDLKPENILLKTLQTPSIKLVDFGSACHEKQTVYTYIQSRFYRSPEVLLGLPYASAIDMWSLGCIAVELFLGLPLFPGTSEYNQICRIAEMLGLPPQHMLDQGKQTGEFFNSTTDEMGRKHYRLKPIDQYSREHNVEEQPSRRYFQANTLPDLIKTYPMARRSGRPADVQKEMANRASFIDFVTGLLNMDPHERWTPQQAKLHPFVTGEKLTKPFKPPPVTAASSLSANPARKSMVVPTDSKHPYGGLQPSNTKSTGRTYTDAAAYSQHLAQQQAYNSVHQATAARQAQPTYHNPYAQDDRIPQQQQQQQLPPGSAPTSASDPKHQYATLQPNSAKSASGEFPDAAAYGQQHLPQHQAYGSPHQGRQTHSQYPNPYSPDDRLQQQQQQQASASKAHAQASRAYSPNMYLPSSSSSHSHHQHGQGQQPQQSSSQQHQHHLQSQQQQQHAHAQAQAQAAAAAQRGLFSVVVDNHDRRRADDVPPVSPLNPSGIAAPPAALTYGQGTSRYLPAGVSGPGSSSAAAAAAAAAMGLPPGSLPSTAHHHLHQHQHHPHHHLPHHYGGASSLGNATASNSHSQSSSSSNNNNNTNNVLPFDMYDTGIAQLMPALQPTQYHPGGGSSGGGGSGGPPGHSPSTSPYSPVGGTGLSNLSLGGSSGGGGGAGGGGGGPQGLSADDAYHLSQLDWQHAGQGSGSGSGTQSHRSSGRF